jgi:hypothetical protein
VSVRRLPLSSVEREQALYNFYSAERRAGACPLTATERMLEFSKRLDGVQEQMQQERRNLLGVGRSRTPEYAIWNSMRERCGNPKHKSFADYGGRGIQVCERWHSFENFITDMGPRPSEQHSLDRYPNNDGNYEPGNCRWATSSEQFNNRRSCRVVTYRHAQMTLKEACDLAGTNYNTVHHRIQSGWEVTAAIDTPIRKKEPNHASR